MCRDKAFFPSLRVGLDSFLPQADELVWDIVRFRVLETPRWGSTPMILYETGLLKSACHFCLSL